MTEDLIAFFDVAEFAETITVAGTPAAGIVDFFTDLQLGEVLTIAREVQLPASSAPGAAEGATVVVRGVTYRVRQVLLEPPDGVVLRLVLAKV